MIGEILKAILLGIVQGVTEWLPVSSTGHMILLDQFLGLDFRQEFVNLFLVVIQLGSILAVVVLFFYRLNPFAPSKSRQEKKATWFLWFKVLVGIIPVGIAGFFLDDLVDAYLHTPWVIGCSLIVYGVIFIVVEARKQRKRAALIEDPRKLSWGQALGVGAAQVASLIPGVSRSGSTMVGGLLLGMDRRAAAEFSFFMAIPVMFGASGYKLVKFGFDFSSSELLVLAVGTVTAFVVSLFVIRFLMNYLGRHGFTPFGIYRIALGAAVLVYFLLIAR